MFLKFQTNNSRFFKRTIIGLIRDGWAMRSWRKQQSHMARLPFVQVQRSWGLQELQDLIAASITGTHEYSFSTILPWTSTSFSEISCSTYLNSITLHTELCDWQSTLPRVPFIPSANETVGSTISEKYRSCFTPFPKLIYVYQTIQKKIYVYQSAQFACISSWL